MDRTSYRVPFHSDLYFSLAMITLEEMEDIMEKGKEWFEGRKKPQIGRDEYPTKGGRDEYPTKGGRDEYPTKGSRDEYPTKGEPERLTETVDLESLRETVDRLTERNQRLAEKVELLEELVKLSPTEGKTNYLLRSRYTGD